MDESLSDMIREKEALDRQLEVLNAMERIVAKTPGATSIEDAERLTGRSFVDLLVEETGFTVEQIDEAATAIMSSDAGDSGGPAS
jgi:hypothetical protein